MDKNGFSNVEVLISMALLCIIIIPMSNATSQTIQTMIYAVDNYNANILVSNILVEAEYIIKNNTDFNSNFDDMYKNENIYSLGYFLQNPDFDEEYHTDKYKYNLSIENMYGDKLVFSTDDDYLTQPSVIKTDNVYLFDFYEDTLFYDYYIVIDNNFIIEKGQSYTIYDNNLMLDLNSFGDEVYVKIYVNELSSQQNIYLDCSNKKIFLDIKVNENVNQELLNIVSYNNIIFEQYYYYEKNLQNYIVTASVYDMEYNLLKTVSKLVTN